MSATSKLPRVDIGFQVFLTDGGEEVGAVRAVTPNGLPQLVVYIENAGDFVVPLAAVSSVHSSKVILDWSTLEPALRSAIGHAHEAEDPGTLRSG